MLANRTSTQLLIFYQTRREYILLCNARIYTLYLQNRVYIQVTRRRGARERKTALISLRRERRGGKRRTTREGNAQVRTRSEKKTCGFLYFSFFIFFLFFLFRILLIPLRRYTYCVYKNGPRAFVSRRLWSRGEKFPPTTKTGYTTRRILYQIGTRNSWGDVQQRAGTRRSRCIVVYPMRR